MLPNRDLHLGSGGTGETPRLSRHFLATRACARAAELLSAGAGVGRGCVSMTFELLSDLQNPSLTVKMCLDMPNLFSCPENVFNSALKSAISRARESNGAVSTVFSRVVSFSQRPSYLAFRPCFSRAPLVPLLSFCH